MLGWLASAAPPATCCWTCDEPGEAELRHHARQTHDGEGHANTGALAQTPPPPKQSGLLHPSGNAVGSQVARRDFQTAGRDGQTAAPLRPRLPPPTLASASPPTSRTASQRAGQQPSEEPGGRGADGRAVSRVNPRLLPDVTDRQLAVTSGGGGGDSGPEAPAGFGDFCLRACLRASVPCSLTDSSLPPTSLLV